METVRADLNRIALLEAGGWSRKVIIKAGGTLLALDLFKAEGLEELVSSAVALPVSLALRLLHTRRLRDSAAVRKAWCAHEQHDSHLALSQARRIFGAVLPGAQVRKHLLRRYSVIWTFAPALSPPAAPTST
jgi:hypothetical protein